MQPCVVAYKIAWRTAVSLYVYKCMVRRRKSLSHMSTWTNKTLLSQHISEYDVSIEYLGQNVRVIADVTY